MMDLSHAPEQTLLAEIKIYSESLFATVFNREQGSEIASTFELHPTAIQEILSSFPTASGLLPAGILFWERWGPNERLAVYLPPARRTLIWKNGHSGDVSYQVPLPGFVFAGGEKEASIFAVKESNIKESTKLYQAPLPNVGSNGKICFGGNSIPSITSQNIGKIADLFFCSPFNSQLSGGIPDRFHENAGEFWKSIEGKSAFPLKELKSDDHLTVGSLMRSEKNRAWEEEYV